VTKRLGEGAKFFRCAPAHDKFSARHFFGEGLTCSRVFDDLPALIGVLALQN